MYYTLFGSDRNDYGLGEDGDGYIYSEAGVQVVGFTNCSKSLKEIGRYQERVQVRVDQPETRETKIFLQLLIDMSEEIDTCTFVGLAAANFLQLTGVFKCTELTLDRCDLTCLEALAFAEKVVTIYHMKFIAENNLEGIAPFVNSSLLGSLTISGGTIEEKIQLLRDIEVSHVERVAFVMPDDQQGNLRTHPMLHDQWRLAAYTEPPNNGKVYITFERTRPPVSFLER